ncbi:MAG: isoaspartyl peptidase/L-asparaginase [Planctomycetes bacterium]|nr:isoaspartyl peptidase/L-asparaginase [Planctomycetota bacterium]
MFKPIILTHGGVGSRSDYSDGCKLAGDSALGKLAGGVAALDAVIDAALILENDERYNAGTGSNLKLDGRCEMDAALMTSDGRFGGVVCVQNVKNPVLLARKIMDSPHNLLCADGALDYAKKQGLVTGDFRTDKARKRLEEALERLRTGALRDSEQPWRDFPWNGTIGAVARDRYNNLAASVSTGGTSIMLPGRIGDSPLIGAGIYVSQIAAVVCTGHGEQITHHLSAKEVHDRIRAGESAQDACDHATDCFPTELSFGVICVTRVDYGAQANQEMAWFASH